MAETGLAAAVALPIGLGLFGFVEPCSIGTTLLFVKTLEGRAAAAKLSQVGVFTGVRAFFVGVLGLAAAALGGAFLGLQKAAWIGFGAVYALIGIAYLAGKSGSIARAFAMREVLGMDTTEICASLGISASNCGVLLYRARMRLRECVGKKWFLGGRR